jgi:1-acyl-sn-glycerol-3-phosphate acyltransferase
MKKILYWPYQLYVWLLFLPLVVVLTLLFGFGSVLAAMVTNPHWASRHVAARWARLLARLTPIWVSVEGAENARQNQSYVVVANHQSQYDILLLYGWLNLDLKWVMKKELRKIPAIGIGCEKVGHIFVDRKRPVAARQAITDALQRMGTGIGILFFAEGTRSDDGRLLPLKKGAFVTAMEQGIPVLPVTIIGTRDVLPARTLRLFPGRVRMVIHPEIPTGASGEMEMATLRDRTRAAIESAQPPELR